MATLRYIPRYCSAMRRAVKRSSKYLLHPRRLRSGSRETACTASSSFSKTNPLTPCRITSGTDPLLLAITGVPQAMASIITSPNGSGQSIGNRRAFAPPRKAAFSPSSTSPMNSISGSSRSGAISASK